MSRTIIAQSTPCGGAVIMIRLSGEKSFEILNKLCKKKIEKFRYAYFTLIDTGTVKDNCVVIKYTANGSYTGEESAEIFCHGSKIIADEIIKFGIRNGAESAERGEFTLKAYLNKKIDLTEAEGILDLINAETVEQAVNAYKNADGELRKSISEIQDELKKIIASVEVAIDYPEEDIEKEEVETAKLRLMELSKRLKKLTDSYNDGKKIKNGVKIVIFGKPNVGKSSLFNAMLGYKRAIVNENAGTTRDVIESEYIYKGRKFVLYDTAGIRQADGIEQEGIIMALDQIKNADLVLDVGISGEARDKKPNSITVTNKCDLSRGEGINISALKGEGIEELKEEIYKRTDFEPQGLKINNLRQYESLVKAEKSILSAINSKNTVDCFAADLFDAYNFLGKVTGAIGSDDIIAEIFSAFCVGK